MIRRIPVPQKSAPDLIVHPLPCFWANSIILAVGSCDVAYFLTLDRFWAQSATWLLLGALIAALPGALVSLTALSWTEVDRVGAACRAVVIVLCVVNLAARTGRVAPSQLAAEITFVAALTGLLGAAWPRAASRVAAWRTAASEADLHY